MPPPCARTGVVQRSPLALVKCGLLALVKRGPFALVKRSLLALQHDRRPTFLCSKSFLLFADKVIMLVCAVSRFGSRYV